MSRQVKHSAQSGNKAVPLHVMKAYRGRRRIAPLILMLGTRWRWVVNLAPLPHPRRLYHRVRKPVPTKSEAVWAPEPVWTFRREKSHATTGTRNPGPSSRGSSVGIATELPRLLTSPRILQFFKLKNKLLSSEVVFRMFWQVYHLFLKAIRHFDSHVTNQLVTEPSGLKIPTT